MKPVTALSRLFLLFALMTAFAAAAQAPRAAPANDDRADAMPITAINTYVVNDIEEATIEGGEALHQCHTGAPNAGANSVWFVFLVPPGTVTLDTSGTAYNTTGNTSVDSIISIYDKGTTGQLACSDTGGGSAAITLHVEGGAYLAQVSAVAGTPITLDSNVTLSISYAPDRYVPANNAFASALKLGAPANPGILNLSSATIEAGEADPSCATEGRTSNSMWYKFTFTKPRTFLALVQNGNLGSDYNSVDIETLSFVLYNAPVSGLPTVADEVVCNQGAVTINILPAGSYYLRVSVDTPGGTSTTSTVVAFATVVGATQNPSFEVSSAPGSLNDPLLPPWKVKGSSGDDFIVCNQIDTDGDCMFRFNNTAGENTTLQIKANLTDMKIKKGDFLLGQVGYRSAAVPDAKLTITVTHTNGSKSVHTLQLAQQPTLTATLIDTLPITGKPASIVFKIKNKTQAGTLDIDLVAVFVARVGTVTRDALSAPAAAPVRPLPPPQGQ